MGSLQKMLKDAVKVSGRDALILVLGFTDGVEGILKLQLMTFMLWPYVPYNYELVGVLPYSKELESDILKLVSEGIVRLRSAGVYRRVELSRDGVRRFNDVLKRIENCKYVLLYSSYLMPSKDYLAYLRYRSRYLNGRCVEGIVSSVIFRVVYRRDSCVEPHGLMAACVREFLEVFKKVKSSDEVVC